MSENDRMQREALLFPIWDEMKALMAEGRGIESSDIQSFADNYVGFFGEAAIGHIAYAQANNLIDGALFFDTTNNVLMVYNLGTTTWLRTTPTSSDQTAINTVNSNATIINIIIALPSRFCSPHY